MAFLSLLNLNVLFLLTGASIEALEFSYVGCIDNPADNITFLPINSRLFPIHVGPSPELCARFCLYSPYQPGAAYSVADLSNDLVGNCECGMEPPLPETLGGSGCVDCGINDPVFPTCSYGTGDTQVFPLPYAAVYHTQETETYNTAVTIGGSAKKDTTVSFYGSDSPSVNCSAIPDAPFVTQNAIALRDKDGRPMVCGGSRNPDPKSCLIYSSTCNKWITGPRMKRRRIGASATCLENGICWIFGGKSREVTEYYDPATHSFNIGPSMPVNSVHGLCTAQSPITGTIYMLARREPGKTRLFTFDHQTTTFEEHQPIEGYDLRYSACAVVADTTFRGGDFFVVIGGGSQR